MKQLCSIALLAATTAACTSDDAITKAIYQQFKVSGKRSVNLDSAVPGPWQRVCVIGPYMNNEATHATLGFKWNSEKVSKVATDDGVALLVFVHADKVAFFTNYPRGKGDFAYLSGKCYARSDAIFAQVGRPDKSWPGLYPKKAQAVGSL